MTTVQTHRFWHHPWLFRLACAGAVISLTNVFSLPMAFSQFGGAFLGAYLLAHLFIALPILVSELLMGRRGRQSAPLSINQLAAEAFVSRQWRYLGVVIVVTGMAIATYYLAFASWALDYAWLVWTQQLPDNELGLRFVLAELLADPVKLIILHSILCVVVVLLLALPSARGILVPVATMALLLLLGVAILSLQAIGTLRWWDGLQHVLSVRSDGLTWAMWSSAVALSFYSLGVGLGISVLLGVHMDARTSVSGTATWIVLVDVCWSVFFAGAVFAFVTPEVGTDALTLLFITLPAAVVQSGLAEANTWLMIFFGVLLLSGLSTGLFLVKGLVIWLHERFSLRRGFAAGVAGFILWVGGVGVLLSFNRWREVRFYGATVFEWLSVLPGTVLLPIIAFLTAIFVGWVLPNHLVIDELRPLYEYRYAVWRFALKFLTTVALVLLLVVQVGAEWSVSGWLQGAILASMMLLLLLWARLKAMFWNLL
ncbi:hypothetical protein ACFOSD_01450 [Salinispirillum marinum]|uniref:Sodium-dependent transporter n=2 Tax=Saccharospirillaceae TaxID=255527 RepID=A0ABV8BA15_9GAMM